MLIMICSMVICNYGTVDNVKAVSQTESSEEEEEILLDDNELSSWEEEEEVWDDDDEIEEDEEDDEDSQEEDIYVDDTIMVISEIKEKWENHYNAEVTVTNLTDTVIDDWTDKFKYKDQIEQIWNVEIESKYVNDNDETTYIIKNKEYNQNIAPGNNSAFGFIAKTTEVNVKVEPVQLFSISSTLQNESEEDDWDSVEEVEGLTEDDFMEYSDYLEYLMLQAEDFLIL